MCCMMCTRWECGQLWSHSSALHSHSSLACLCLAACSLADRTLTSTAQASAARKSINSPYITINDQRGSSLESILVSPARRPGRKSDFASFCRGSQPDFPRSSPDRTSPEVTVPAQRLTLSLRWSRGMKCHGAQCYSFAPALLETVMTIPNSNTCHPARQSASLHPPTLIDGFWETSRMKGLWLNALGDLRATWRINRSEAC